MVLPVQHQARQQVRPAQHRAVRGARRAQRHVVAAAGAGVAAVEHELLGPQPGLARVLVQRLGVVHQLAPRRRGMDVDLDDAGVRRHLQLAKARVGRRLVALQHHRDAQLRGGLLHRGQQVQEVLEVGQRRQEHVDETLADLHAQRRRHVPGVAAMLLGHRLRGRRPRRGPVAQLQRRALGERIGRRLRLLVRRLQARQRQAQPQRRIARQQVQALAAQAPACGAPRAAAAPPGVERERQHVAAHAGEALAEARREAPPIQPVVQVRLHRILARRQAPLLQQQLGRVLVRVDDVVRRHREARRERLQEAPPFGHRVRAGVAGRGEALRIAPHRHAVGAPQAGERPARQRLARIPLALPVVQHAPGGEALAEATDQRAGEPALVLAERGDGPLGAVHVVHADEGRLAALGQAHVAGLQPRVDDVAQRERLRPVGVAHRARHARVLVHAGHAVVEVELDLAGIRRAGHRRRARRIRGARERNVTLAGEQPGRGVQPDPAGAGQVHLGPRVQVGEVLLRARRTVQRLLVRRELHQVAGHEARREPRAAQRLHQQPAGVAARPDAPLQRLLAGLHAGLHAHAVLDVTLQALVHLDQEVHGRARSHEVQPLHPGLKQRAALAHLQVRREVARELRVVAERKAFGVLLEEEVERVDHRHVGHQVDLEDEVARALGEHEAREVVAERILLPVHEVLARLHLQRVAVHRRAGVRRRAQPDHVRRHRHGAVEAVLGAVVDGDADGQEAGSGANADPSYCRPHGSRWRRPRGAAAPGCRNTRRLDGLAPAYGRPGMKRARKCLVSWSKPETASAASRDSSAGRIPASTTARPPRARRCAATACPSPTAGACADRTRCR